MKTNISTLVTALNYYELGKKYLRQNETERASIFFWKSFKLKTNFYDRCDDPDLVDTFSKIGQSLTTGGEIHHHVYFAKARSTDGDRCIAYYISNTALAAYAKGEYSFAKQQFTKALRVFESLPDTTQNVEILKKYLTDISLKQSFRLSQDLRLEDFDLGENFCVSLGGTGAGKSPFIDAWYRDVTYETRKSVSFDSFPSVSSFAAHFKSIDIPGWKVEISILRQALASKNVFTTSSSPWGNHHSVYHAWWNYKRKPKYLMIEKYYNNTHRIKDHLLLLDLLFRASPNSQLTMSMCQELCYYLFTDHFRDSDYFRTQYSFRSASEWYRGDSGVCRIINIALRMKNLAQIHDLHRFISDFYKELHVLYERQKPDDVDSMVLTAFRGQRISRKELASLVKNVGQVVYNNNFFSVTFNRTTATTFATGSPTTEYVLVLFEIQIDTSHTTQCYGYFPESGDEQELVCTPGTIFRLQSVERIHYDLTQCNISLSDEEKSDFWLIKMAATDEQQLLGETLTIISENSEIGAGQPVAICLFLAIL